MKISSWFFVLLLGTVIMAAPVSSASSNNETAAAPKTVRWTIQKLKLVHGTPKIFVIGSNGQYISRSCSRYEVESIKYHFWHEEAYDLRNHSFCAMTFIEGFHAIVDERANNKPIDIVANIIAVACLEGGNHYQVGKYNLKPEHCTDSRCLNEELMAKVVARLDVISDGKLSIEKAAPSDAFVIVPEAGTAYAKLVLIERSYGKRHPFLVRADNSPTVQFGFVK